MLFDQVGDIVRAQTGVMDPFRVYHHFRSLGTGSDPGSFQDLNFVDQTLGDQLILQTVDDLVCSLIQTLRIHTHQYM
jgi:hypothetical protein